MINKKKLKKGLSALVLCVVATASLCACSGSKTVERKTLEDLAGCEFALSNTNASFESLIKEHIPGTKISYYTNYYDTFVEVANGTKDAAFCLRNTFIPIKEAFDSLEIVPTDVYLPIGMNFSTDEKSEQIKKDFNEFTKIAAEDGTLDKLVDMWVVNYKDRTAADAYDFSTLSGDKGTFDFASSTDNKPFAFPVDGGIGGLEIGYMYEFCKAYGYTPTMINPSYDSVMAGVASGRYNVGAGGYCITEERSKQANLSEPMFNDEVVYVVKGTSASDSKYSLKTAIEKNLIKDNRWKMVVNGLISTILITLCTVAFGSTVGFCLFLAGYKNPTLCGIFSKINSTFEALPPLVVLMVFFYAIFGKVKISGFIVAILVFSLLFAFTFFSQLTGSVSVVPREQFEAGRALGYTESGVLYRIIIPQALETFLPGYKSAIISLLKTTSIVGYVAVRDLTKASDLIRSQTFDTFFPIIFVAIIYFILAKLLLIILNWLLMSPMKKRRKTGNI